MKKYILLSITMAVMVGQANAGDLAQVELISMSTYDAGGTIAQLPTVRNTDGSICQSYIQDMSRDSRGKVTTTIGKVCGAAGDHGGGPASLISLQNFEAAGLTVQLPTVRTNENLICKSYVENMSRDGAGATSIQVGKLCTPAIANGAAHRKLTSLDRIDSNGLGIQLPTAELARPSI